MVKQILQLLILSVMVIVMPAWTLAAKNDTMPDKIIVRGSHTIQQTMDLIRTTALDSANDQVITDILSVHPVSKKDACPFSWFSDIESVLINEIKYQVDEKGIEQVKTPGRMFRDGFGDCDDFTVFWCSLMNRIGKRSVIKVVGYSASTWNHVYTIVPGKGKMLKNGFLVLDTVSHFFYGKFPLEVNHVRSKTMEA